MRALLGGTLAVLCLGTGLWAQDKKDEKIDTKKLVGKWAPKEKKEGVSVVVEFTKDGKTLFAFTSDGKETKSEGTYKVDGSKLSLTYKAGDKEQTHTVAVSKLTDTELATKDEKGKEETFVRVRDK